MRCICGNEIFNEIETSDVGFDHASYEAKITSKRYLICRDCGTIIRNDNNIREPFNENYFSYECTRKCKKIEGRFKDLIRFIRKLYRDDEVFTVCDFGASDGRLLLDIKKEFSGANLIGIDLATEELQKNKIKAYNT